MILDKVIVGAYQVNCYILADAPGAPAVLIDPGADAHKIRRALQKHSLIPAAIIHTHGHIDHIGADHEFSGLPIYVHRLDAPLLGDPELNLSNFLGQGYSVSGQIHPVDDGQLITVGEVILQVIHTPGHSPGGMCLLLKSPPENVVFTGDTLFYQGVGRTDFPGASQDTLAAAIKSRLFTLPDELIVYPGHAASSTIGDEKRNNPFLE